MRTLPAAIAMASLACVACHAEEAHHHPETGCLRMVCEYTCECLAARVGEVCNAGCCEYDDAGNPPIGDVCGLGIDAGCPCGGGTCVDQCCQRPDGGTALPGDPVCAP